MYAIEYVSIYILTYSYIQSYVVYNNYMKSEDYKCLQQELTPILDDARKNPIGSAPNYANSLFWQVTTCFKIN